MNLERITRTVVYGFGITGKWFSSHSSAAFFVDTDSKKWDQSFEGRRVFSPSSLSSLTDNDLVVVTVVDIFDVIPILNFYGVKWIALSDLLGEEAVAREVITANTTTESTEFLQYSLDTVLACQRAYLDNKTFYLRSVDLVVTEKCTLKCKDCANLMQFYDTPSTYEFEEIIGGIRNLALRCEFINEVRVIGGEPFVNKDIYRIIESVAQIKNIKKIVIYTNGMVPPKKDKLASLNLEKVVFSVTDYGELGRNLDNTIQCLQELGVAHRVHPPEHWTDSGRILENPTGEDFAQQEFSKCCGKNLYTLVRSELYRCPFAANAEQFQGIPRHPSNSVSVLGEGSEIRSFSYSEKAFDACRWCPGRSFDAPLITPAIQAPKPIPHKKFPIDVTVERA